MLPDCWVAEAPYASQPNLINILYHLNDQVSSVIM